MPASKNKTQLEALNNQKRRGTLRATRAWLKNLVAQLYLSGSYTSEGIAEYLKERHDWDVKSVTIRKWLADMKTEWQKSALQDTNTMITAELARLQQVETFAIQALRDGGLRVTDDGLFIGADAKEYCDIMLKISKRRSALMGLDKAQKIVLTDHRTSELTDEELEKIVLMTRKKAVEI